MATYRTKQQQAVLDCLSARPESPLSVMELAQLLRQTGLSVGISTIYRQLEKLEQQGLVHKIRTEEGAFFQYCESGSEGCVLLKCQHCGQILHAHCHELQHLYGHLSQHHQFTIDPRKTVFYGCCDSCGSQERSEIHVGE